MLYKQVKSVLKIPRDIIYILITYSVLLGFLYLTIPVSVQTLVNLVGASLSIRPVISLLIILFVLLTVYCFIQLVQSKLIEQLQRKVFLDLITRAFDSFYKLKLNNLTEVNVREKLNRLFEIKLLQKSVAVIFVTLLDIVLQVTFCVIVLAFYHPVFLIFDILLIVSILLAIFIPLKSGYKARHSESSEIYSIANWFQEKPSSFLSFKQSHKPDLLTNVDNQLCSYLTVRDKFFSILFRQYVYIAIIYIFINILLLGMSSYLIILGQLSIGQLIAAELLVNTVLLGLFKFRQYLYDCYDFFVSSKKFLGLLGLPKEQSENTQENNIALANDISLLDININAKQNISFDFQQESFKKINLSSKIAQEILNGFFESDDSETIKINEISINNYDKKSFIDNIYLTTGTDVIEGTILENLCEGECTPEKTKYLKQLLKIFEMDYLENIFAKNIDSQVVKYDLRLNPLVIFKINLIRAILRYSKLLIVIDTFKLLNSDDNQRIIEFLQNLEKPILVITTE